MMQELKRNWLVVLKLAKGIWRILTRAFESFKSLHFNGLPLTKVYNFRAKKVWRSYPSLHWKAELWFEKWHEKFVKFSPKDLKVSKLELWWDLLSKVKKVYIIWAKKVQWSYLSWNWRVMQNLDRNRLVVSKLTWGIWQILTWELESRKNFRFNTAPLLKSIYCLS